MKKILTRRRVKVAHGERTLADNSKSFNLKFPITCPTALDTDFFCSVFKFSAFFFLSISVNYFASFFEKTEDYVHSLKEIFFHLEFYLYTSPFL